MESLLDDPWLLGLIIAVFLSAVIEAGHQTAIRVRIQENANRKEQMVAIRDGLFILVGLLFGFTLALAAPRFADRRKLLIEETNAIGTTYLRAGTLPQPIRDQARQLLRQYVDARLDLDDAGLDGARFTEAANRGRHILSQLWEGVEEVTKSDRSAVSGLYVNSVNQTIDLEEERISSLENRIPRPVWLLIFSVSTIAIFTRGLTLAGRFWLTLILAPLTVAIVVALIADLDTPSSGLIQVDHRAMMRLKAEINGQP